MAESAKCGTYLALFSKLKDPGVIHELPLRIFETQSQLNLQTETMTTNRTKDLRMYSLNWQVGPGVLPHVLPTAAGQLHNPSANSQQPTNF